MCLLTLLHAALRRRGVSAEPSLRWADPRWGFWTVFHLAPDAGFRACRPCKSGISAVSAPFQRVVRWSPRSRPPSTNTAA
jgi:hypothetical protein